MRLNIERRISFFYIFIIQCRIYVCTAQFLLEDKGSREGNCVSSVLRIHKYEKVCKTYLIIIGKGNKM